MAEENERLSKAIEDMAPRSELSAAKKDLKSVREALDLQRTELANAKGQCEVAKQELLVAKEEVKSLHSPPCTHFRHLGNGERLRVSPPRFVFLSPGPLCEDAAMERRIWFLVTRREPF